MPGRQVAAYLRRHHIALIALFVALGGTSYAAIRLPRNSVGWLQIRGNAITSSKIRDGSLSRRDFAPGQLPPVRAASSDGGTAGGQGIPGPAGPFPDGPLPGGKTLRGYFDISSTAAGGATWASTSISFAFPLAAAPVAHYIATGEPAPAGCGGTVGNPGADPGHLSIYEGGRFNVQVAGTTAYPTNDGTATRFGGAVFARSSASFDPKRPDFFVRGTWAVTAP
jgi:hypothetical protein